MTHLFYIEETGKKGEKRGSWRRERVTATAAGTLFVMLSMLPIIMNCFLWSWRKEAYLIPLLWVLYCHILWYFY